jgi:hypothetical protein
MTTASSVSGPGSSITKPRYSVKSFASSTAVFNAPAAALILSARMSFYSPETRMRVIESVRADICKSLALTTASSGVRCS